MNERLVLKTLDEAIECAKTTGELLLSIETGMALRDSLEAMRAKLDAAEKAILAWAQGCSEAQAKLDAVRDGCLDQDGDSCSKREAMLCAAWSETQAKLDESVAREAALWDEGRKCYGEDWRWQLSLAALELLEKAQRCDRAVDDLIKASNERDSYRADAEKWRALPRSREHLTQFTCECWAAIKDADALQRENAALRFGYREFVKYVQSFQSIGYFTNDEWQSRIDRALAQLDAKERSDG